MFFWSGFWLEIFSRKVTLWGSIFLEKIFWSMRIAVFEASRMMKWLNFLDSTLFFESFDIFDAVLEVIFRIRESSLELRWVVSGSLTKLSLEDIWLWYWEISDGMSNDFSVDFSLGSEIIDCWLSESFV